MRDDGGELSGPGEPILLRKDPLRALRYFCASSASPSRASAASASPAPESSPSSLSSSPSSFGLGPKSSTTAVVSSMMPPFFAAALTIFSAAREGPSYSPASMTAETSSGLRRSQTPSEQSTTAPPSRGATGSDSAGSQLT